MAALLSLSLELFVGSCSPLSFGGCACWLFVFNFWFQLRIGVTITGGGTHFLNHALTYPLYVHIPIEADPGSSIRRSSVHLSSGWKWGMGMGCILVVGFSVSVSVSVFAFLSPVGSSLGRIATLSKFFV